MKPVSTQPGGDPGNAAALRQALQTATTLLRTGRASEALALLMPLLEQTPREPNLQQLAGLAHKALNQLPEALVCLRRSLELAPAQPAFHHNLGNTLRLLGQTKEAETAFRRAVELEPGYADAWQHLGQLLMRLDRQDEAVVALRKAVKLRPRDVGKLSSLGSALQESGDLTGAIETLESALAINPDHVNALSNLGVTRKLADDYDGAIACYRRAERLAPAVAEIDYNHGNALVEKGSYDEAEQRYLSAIEKRPDYVEAHVTLNELYWQTGRKEAFGSSFERAIAVNPDHLGLREAYARSLEFGDRRDDALRQLDDALTRLGPRPGLLHRRARLLADRGEHASAVTSFDEALALEPSDEIRLDYAALLISEGRYHDALAHLEDVERRQPDQQLMWALRSLCWRLLGDERYHWLNDYGNFVRPFTLPVPDGYASLPEFLGALESQLLAMHRMKAQPLEQTLKHGTQTPGRLLYKPLDEIRAFRTSLTEVVNEYIAGLPRDPAHPLLRRNTGRFRFSGSWSVKLSPGGFHVNHVHPQGWISSAFYVTLPHALSMLSEDANDGCIKFGESSLHLAEREKIERVIRPAAGVLVLFPSYVWHGTFAFHGAPEDYRMTAPFDAVPD